MNARTEPTAENANGEPEADRGDVNDEDIREGIEAFAAFPPILQDTP